MLAVRLRRTRRMERMGRLLGLDIGERRIGVAISDPEGRLAVPVRVLERCDDLSDRRALTRLARAEEVVGLVAGYPVSLDGVARKQAQRVAAFARRLAEEAGLPIELWDERLTTAQVDRAAAGRHRTRPTDDLAAAIILQAYLDSQRAESVPEA